MKRPIKIPKPFDTKRRRGKEKINRFAEESETELGETRRPSFDGRRIALSQSGGERIRTCTGRKNRVAIGWKR